MRAIGFPVHVQKEHLLVCTSLGIHLYLTVSLERLCAKYFKSPSVTHNSAKDGDKARYGSPRH